MLQVALFFGVVVVFDFSCSVRSNTSSECSEEGDEPGDE